MGRRQAAGAAQLRSIRRRWSAHRCRPLAAHRPLFLAVPEIDDEDRLGAGVIHPDDSPGGGSSGDSGTVGEGVSCRGAEGPAAWTRHQESLVVAGPAFPFCACFASGGWARLSGPARFSATEPVAGGRPSVQHERDPYRSPRQPDARPPRHWLRRQHVVSDRRVGGLAIAVSPVSTGRCWLTRAVASRSSVRNSTREGTRWLHRWLHAAGIPEFPRRAAIERSRICQIRDLCHSSGGRI